MGLDYEQICIFGFKVKNCKKIIAPAVYKKQNRYDPKTGKRTHKENVLVQYEESVCEAFDIQGESVDELCYNLGQHYANFNFQYEFGNNNTIYVGFVLGESNDYGRVHLVGGRVFLDKLKSMEEVLKKEFGEVDCAVYFLQSIG